MRLLASITAALLALAFAAAPLPAPAQGFDIPDGFVSEIVRKGGLGEDGELSVLRVRPLEGRFARLSHVDLAPLPAAVGDPEAWLRARMTTSLESWLPDPQTLLDGADSPFSDPAFDPFRDTLGNWIDSVAALGDLPLEFCGAVEIRANALGYCHELRCSLPRRRVSAASCHAPATA